MEIPYAVSARPDTGLANGKFGIWLFLASEVMLFGALFATYVLLRVGNPEWPAGHTILNIPRSPCARPPHRGRARCSDCRAAPP